MNGSFPWYDSLWLQQYVAARKLIQRVRPALLPEFTQAFACFRTRPDFAVQEVERVFDEATMEKVREVIRTLRVDKIETHETRTFGRLIVHNQPYFTELQRSMNGLVSELAGEPVEPCYNFLSLYSKFGVCSVHLDAPAAKWTLDICIDQSDPWPIHFSQVVPWPEDFQHPGDDWQDKIRQSPDLRFTSHTLYPGRALFFSGSSQWHYRDPLPSTHTQGSCKLLFFHFIPAGTYELSRPKNWARLFGMPELAEVTS